MTRNLALLHAAEEACAERLKLLCDARDDALAAMEHANTTVLCGALSVAELERLDHAGYGNGLASLLDVQFQSLIDAATTELWAAKIAIEEAESEPSSLTEYAQAAE